VNEPSPMCQFVDFLLHHGPPRVTTIALSHNGVRDLVVCTRA
jgi:hypothetical protein